MNKKIILTIVGLAVVGGLGVLAVKYNSNLEERNSEVPIPTSPSPIENPKPTENFSEFGKAITLKLNDKIAFSDGLTVILTFVDDSRCKPNVQCIWAGELAAVLEVSGGKISNPGEVHLGTMNNKSVSVEGYTFSLKNATTTSVTIEVVKK
jgi:hypothetical protein